MDLALFSADELPEQPASPKTYQVLARKYRPKTFADLVGQEAMVQTLTHALQSNRLAHAYMLTGIRGVGKTTTARIIARALNCSGADGAIATPTANICGVCNSCIGIGEDRHPDVMEMDAASRTGVDDIRDIIEGVQYRPISGRYKVYIIDEVHMLSKQAFNALLKTLEEPPPHVKFIFATTEIRRVPVTILSRCQRFDLKRITPQILSDYLQNVAQKENAAIDSQALALLTRAADGSMRDGLSLLDQAIAHAEQKNISEDTVKNMLGLADRHKIMDLYEKIMQGSIDQALVDFQQLGIWGADPVLVIQDLIELTHVVSKLKVAPQIVETMLLDQQALGRLQQWAQKLSIPVLSRSWQVLTKGLNDVLSGYQPQAHAEMLLIRLAFLQDQPTPNQLGLPAEEKTAPIVASQTEAQSIVVPTLAIPNTVEDFIAWLKAQRQPLLVAHLVQDVEILDYAPGHFKVALRPTAPAQLTNKLKSVLDDLTNINWTITVEGAQGQATLQEKREAIREDLKQKTMESPETKSLLDAFPGAELITIFPTE